MSVQNHIKTIAYLKTKVKAHCMTANFEETDCHYLVLFPRGFRIDGVRVSKGIGCINALNILLEKCEMYWQLDQL